MCFKIAEVFNILYIKIIVYAKLKERRKEKGKNPNTHIKSANTNLSNALIKKNKQTKWLDMHCNDN